MFAGIRLCVGTFKLSVASIGVTTVDFVVAVIFAVFFIGFVLCGGVC